MKQNQRTSKGSILRKQARSCRCLLHSAMLSIMFYAMPALAVEEKSPSVTDPVIDLAQTGSLALTLLKVFGSLVLVVGLMLFIATWMKKLGLSQSGLRQGTLIEVLDSKMIAPKKYVAVVQVAEETLALGITDQQITMLTRLEEGDSLREPGSENQSLPKTPFSSLLGKAIKRG